MADVFAKEPRILEDPAPQMAMVELADSSVNFVVRPWVQSSDYWGVYMAVHEAIKKAFDAEGISTPYPQRDVHLYQHAAAYQRASASAGCDSGPRWAVVTRRTSPEYRAWSGQEGPSPD